MSEKIGVGQALKAAFSFWPRGVSQAPGVLAVAGISTAWSVFVGGQKGAGVLWFSASIICSLMQLMAYAALYRVAYLPKKPNDPELALGPLGFQSGKVEMSVVMAGLLTSALLAFVMALLLLGLSALAVGLNIAEGPPTQSWADFVARLGPSKPIVFAAMAGATLLLVWLSVRLSLGMAASAAERRVRVLSAWPLTAGQGLTLFICFLILGIPLIGLAELASLTQDTATRLAPAFRPDLEAGTLITFAIASVFYFFPLVAGLTAYVYERVGPTPSPESKAP